jgi:PKHD-type hydroxylase
MYLKYKYWYFKNLISPEDCKKIIKLGVDKKLGSGTIGMQKNKKKVNKKIRDSKVTWLKDQWIYNIFNQAVNYANEKAGWNFDTDWNENIQFTSYKKNGFYNWHYDMFQETIKDKDEHFNNKQRKLSMSCLLNDPKDYKGGDFMLQWIDDNGKLIKHKVKELDTVGSIIVFPSFLNHKVEPVTKGTRYSAVMWRLGPQFK